MEARSSDDFEKGASVFIFNSKGVLWAKVNDGSWLVSILWQAAGPALVTVRVSAKIESESRS